ncbi:MAG: hypothetical protein AABW83_00795 [Nanoarchaeota archaeon]
MKFFINKIFDNENDNLVHIQFSKFSRGEFKNKAMISCKSLPKRIYKINTTSEYANEFVRFLAEKLNKNSTNVNGIIVSTRDLTGELDFQDKKQFMGIKQYIINKNMTGLDIINLCDKFPNAFFGLNFSVNNTELNIKQKAPKSSKPSTKGESEQKVDFCKLKTDDKELINNLIFDIKDFKKIEINHTFLIKEIIIDDKLKGETGNDYALIKEKAKRKGKIIRKIKIDGIEKISEKDFEI